MKIVRNGEQIFPPEHQRGICCPRCDCPDLRVTNTYPEPDRTTTRRRVCRHCGYVVSTRERLQHEPGIDIKT